MGKKIKKKIDIPLDIEAGLANIMLMDAVIAILKNKKIITDKEIQAQIKVNTAEAEEFVKRHPEVITTIQNAKNKEIDERTYRGSYIG